MLSIEYYHKLKSLYRQEVSKAEFIYIYTVNSRVEKVLFKFRKNKYKEINDMPNDELLLSRDKVLPQNVLVQVKFNPLEFLLYEY